MHQGVQKFCIERRMLKMAEQATLATVVRVAIVTALLLSFSPTVTEALHFGASGSCSEMTATLAHGLHADWVEITGAIIHAGRVKVRTPAAVDLSSVSLRRLLWITQPDRHLPLDFVNNTDHCSCDKVIKQPSLVMEPFMWGHFGHTTFDTFTGVYATINESHIPPGDVVLYMSFSKWNSQVVETINEAGQVNLGDFFEEMFSVLTSQPVQAWHALVEESKSSTICFDRLLIGTSHRIGHYQSNHDMPDFDVSLMNSLSTLLSGKLAPYAALDTTCKYRVTILDRQGTRRIWNINELAAAIIEHLQSQNVQGHCVDVINAEALSFSQQYHLFHNTRVLIGVDGTGLLNSAFMKFPCSGCVHIKPFLQDVVDAGKEGEFKQFCTRFAGEWESWENSNFSSVVWSEDIEAERVELARTGSREAHDRLRALPNKYHVARNPSMHVNIPELMQHIVKVIDATRAVAC